MGRPPRLLAGTARCSRAPSSTASRRRIATSAAQAKERLDPTTGANQEEQELVDSAAHAKLESDKGAIADAVRAGQVAVGFSAGAEA